MLGPGMHKPETMTDRAPADKGPRPEPTFRSCSPALAIRCLTGWIASQRVRHPALGRHLRPAWSTERQRISWLCHGGRLGKHAGRPGRSRRSPVTHHPGGTFRSVHSGGQQNSSACDRFGW
jgi:hypothetical protein